MRYLIVAILLAGPSHAADESYAPCISILGELLEAQEKIEASGIASRTLYASAPGMMIGVEEPGEKVAAANESVKQLVDAFAEVCEAFR